MTMLKVVQIGVGGFGLSWLQLLQSNPNVELVGVVDQQLESLEKAQEHSSLGEGQLFHSLEEAMEKVEPDFVLIVTPPTTHKMLAEKALAYGLHVIMEKPLTDTVEEAESLLAFCQDYTQKVMVSQNYRWNAQIQTIKQLLTSNAIGDVEYGDYYFNKATRFGGWRDQYDEILLQDMTIHHFDILRYLLGVEATHVEATSFKPTWSWFNGKPNANALLTFENHIKIQYVGRWAGKGRKTPWNGEIRLVGEKGAIELVDDQVYLYQDEEDTPENIPLTKIQGSDRETSLEAFVQSIVEDTTPPTSIEDNIHSLKLTWAAIQSAKSGERIQL